VARRQSVLAVSGFAAAAALATNTGPAVARQNITNIIVGSRCSDCSGGGIKGCLMCEGSGKYSLIGSLGPTPDYQYVLVTCPDCQGQGKRICEKCRGTGLSERKMKGMERDPRFDKINKRLRTQNVEIEYVPEIQKEVKEAMALVAADDKAAKEAAAAAEAAAKSAGGGFPFPF